MNRQLLLYAAGNLPAMVIDCANAANPHWLFPEISEEALHRVFVVEVELIYTYRDAVRRLPELMERTKAICCVITTQEHLFHYQDELENAQVHAHVWEMLKKHGERFDIKIGISEKSKQIAAAQRSCVNIEVIK